VLEEILNHAIALFFMVGIIRLGFGAEQACTSVALAIVAGIFSQSFVIFYLVLWFSVPQLLLAGLVGWVIGGLIVDD
jgi:hypothetical protein